MECKAQSLISDVLDILGSSYWNCINEMRAPEALSSCCPDEPLSASIDKWQTTQVLPLLLSGHLNYSTFLNANEASRYLNVDIDTLPWPWILFLHVLLGSTSPMLLLSISRFLDAQ